ncbi:GNAT family N-acetyltransferase [Photobacterium sp. TY1-4]|uniref:GNAT family N-acetyltransferase n=1 Tax=Photobacterium sp. TY1-4 TaxID=2899122 RepID=UPI0021BE3537|nr:GNAT family N-acetyltransferase [Photobacterium sp. TY1-4]UXI01162.1 GNAT family N-acetyltransferase [Photobacterium sp. TY1-4]
MSNLRFHPIEALRFPLINRLYKTYYPAGKAKKDETIWVGEDTSGLICCVRFKQFEHEQLLTGMLVHPAHRGQDLGLALLAAAREQLHHLPCYCFAFRYLEGLYHEAGFRLIADHDLPEALSSRIRRYRQSGKDLIAMQFDPLGINSMSHDASLERHG